MSAAAVSLRSVVKRFGDFVAVAPLSLDIPEGTFLTLLGPSGCGKTTTLRMIAGLLDPTEGDIDIRGLRVNDVPIHRRNLGLVFQNYALFPHKTIFDNVAFGLKYRDVAEGRYRAEGEGGAGTRAASRCRRPLPGAAFGRPAAAHRPGPRHRHRARRAPARRAALGPRRQSARGHARRTQAHPARDRDHHGLRHPRPVRGAGDVGPDRGDARRSCGAGGPARGGLQPSRQRIRRPVPRRLEHRAGPRGIGRCERCARRCRGPRHAHPAAGPAARGRRGRAGQGGDPCGEAASARRGRH